MVSKLAAIWRGVCWSEFISYSRELWLKISNLEWERGYKPRFGLTVVDKKDGFKRHPKDSSAMLRDIYRYLTSK